MAWKSEKQIQPSRMNTNSANRNRLRLLLEQGLVTPCRAWIAGRVDQSLPDGRLTGAPASISPGSSARAIISFTGDSMLNEPPVKTAIRSRDGTRYTFWPPFPDNMIVSIL